jgi:hypothetical protein
MFSVLKRGLIYKDVTSDIVDHDTDFEAEEWVYDTRNVYRGSLDPQYAELNVYWLYDENLRRVGLVEHEIDHPEVFQTLWIQENPFATLFQDARWTTENETLWSRLSNEAYQDCLETDFRLVFDQALQSNTLLLTPERLMQKELWFYECSTCGKKSFSELKGCSALKKIVDFNHYCILFLDDSFVIYTKPDGFKLQELHASFEQELQVPAEQLPQPENLMESQEPLMESESLPQPTPQETLEQPERSQ